jgi:hypothetical protein
MDVIFNGNFGHGRDFFELIFVLKQRLEIKLQLKKREQIQKKVIFRFGPQNLEKNNKKRTACRFQVGDARFEIL